MTLLCFTMENTQIKNFFIIVTKRSNCLIHFCCSVSKLCLTLCNSMDCSMPGSSVLQYFLEFAQVHIYWVCDDIQPFYPLPPLLLLPSIFPSLRVFPSELAVRIRWLIFWNFSFSTSPSNEYLDKLFICLWPEGFVMCGLLSAWWGFGCSLRRDWGRLLRVFLQKEKLLSGEISTNKNILYLTRGTLLSTL